MNLVPLHDAVLGRQSALETLRNADRIIRDLRDDLSAHILERHVGHPPGGTSSTRLSVPGGTLDVDYHYDDKLGSVSILGMRAT